MVLKSIKTWKVAARPSGHPKLFRSKVSTNSVTKRQLSFTPYSKVIGLTNYKLRISNYHFKSSRILLVMQWCFNTPKAGPLSCVTSPIQKEKIKIVILSILNVLGSTYYVNTRCILENFWFKMFVICKFHHILYISF